MLLVFQYADADKSKERHFRYMMVAQEQRALYSTKPVDYERIHQLSERSLTILKEKEKDPWVIRNLSYMASGLIFLGIGISWLESIFKPKKQNA